MLTYSRHDTATFLFCDVFSKNIRVGIFNAFSVDYNIKSAIPRLRIRVWVRISVSGEKSNKMKKSGYPCRPYHDLQIRIRNQRPESEPFYPVADDIRTPFGKIRG